MKKKTKKNIEKVINKVSKDICERCENSSFSNANGGSMISALAELISASARLEPETYFSSDKASKE